MIRPEDTAWILDKIRERIEGRTVVEIGAGIGVLAVEMAKVAKHVYAIEAYPAWGEIFARHLLKRKTANLTFIIDAAENLTELIKADVAVCVTGSDDVWLRSVCGWFAPEVIMPWQDYRGGRAIVPMLVGM